MTDAVRAEQLFRKMQEAEARKDIDPAAYRQARLDYLGASQGSDWMPKEENRLGKEADAKTKQWLSEFDTLQTLRKSQQPNLELVRAAGDKQVGLQTDVQYAIDSLRKRLSKASSDQYLNERLAYLKTNPWQTPRWLLTLFDGLIVVLLLYAIYVLYTTFGKRFFAASALAAAYTAQNRSYDLFAQARSNLLSS